MDDVLNVIAGALKGIGRAKAVELGQELRGMINQKVAGSDPTWDNDLVEVVDGLVEGLGDDTAGLPE